MNRSRVPPIRALVVLACGDDVDVTCEGSDGGGSDGGAVDMGLVGASSGAAATDTAMGAAAADTGAGSGAATTAPENDDTET